jgi:hypothetical protein
LHDGIWVVDFRLADCFDNTKSALKACEEYDLGDVEMVLVLGEVPTERDIVLPIVSDFSGPDAGFSETT